MSRRGSINNTTNTTTEDVHMVICPIALAVHCTGCPLVKICPAKTILGDYGKEEGKSANPGDDPGQKPEKKSSDTNP